VIKARSVILITGIMLNL